MAAIGGAVRQRLSMDRASGVRAPGDGVRHGGVSQYLASRYVGTAARRAGEASVAASMPAWSLMM
jgi:hypothetical protein